MAAVQQLHADAEDHRRCIQELRRSCTLSSSARHIPAPALSQCREAPSPSTCCSCRGLSRPESICHHLDIEQDPCPMIEDRFHTGLSIHSTKSARDCRLKIELRAPPSENSTATARSPAHPCHGGSSWPLLLFLPSAREAMSAVGTPVELSRNEGSKARAPFRSAPRQASAALLQVLGARGVPRHDPMASEYVEGWWRTSERGRISGTLLRSRCSFGRG